MKKLMLIMTAAIFSATLVYAEIDTDLKKEISATVKTELQTQTEKMALENQANMEFEEENADEDEMLREYIDFCGGNEMLGKKLYDIRSGVSLRANVRGHYKIGQNIYVIEDYPIDDYPTDLVIVRGYLPFEKVTDVQKFYPKGIYWIEFNTIPVYSHTIYPVFSDLDGDNIVIYDDMPINYKIKHISGPALAAVVAQYISLDRDNSSVYFKLKIYQEEGEEVAINKYGITRERDREKVSDKVTLSDFEIFDSESKAIKYAESQIRKTQKVIEKREKEKKEAEEKQQKKADKKKKQKERHDKWFY